MRYKIETLKDFIIDIIKKAGLPQEDAEVFADNLVCADMRGISSHGISRLGIYAKRVKMQLIKPEKDPEVICGTDSLLLVDGYNGMGTSVGIKVMDMCIERARKQGSCFATVRNANHFGIAAYYTMYAAQKGMIAFAMSNAAATVVPVGGRKPMLGTNPISIAVPAGKHKPLVLDMATSTVARGKLVVAAKEKKEIPVGWALDKNGYPTTDPNSALEGAMLPFGGPKGYAIGLIVDLLCSAFSGALNSTKIQPFLNGFEKPQDVGFFMGVFDVSKILPIDAFKKRVDEIFDEIKACPTAAGYNEVFIPGEMAYNRTYESEKNGVEISNTVIESLRTLSQEYKVAFPF